MTHRQAHLRERAARDVQDAIAHLAAMAGDAAAQSFIDALEGAVNFVTRSPNAGSLRFAYELAIPELRAWSLKRHPYVMFYVSHDDRIDIWRVLHARRDLPGAFRSGP